MGDPPHFGLGISIADIGNCAIRFHPIPQKKKGKHMHYRGWKTSINPRKPWNDNKPLDPRNGAGFLLVSKNPKRGFTQDARNRLIQAKAESHPCPILRVFCSSHPAFLGVG